MVKRSYFLIDPGDPSRPETWRRRIDALALHSSMFSIFGINGRAPKNDDFLASLQNVQNQRISRAWKAHVAILKQKHVF